MGCSNAKETSKDLNAKADRTDLDKAFEFIETHGYFVESRTQFNHLTPASPAKCPYKVALKPGKT